MFQTYWVGKLVVSLALVGLGLSGFSGESVKAEMVDPSVNRSTLVQDIPEEVLRTEIYTEARSPVDGKLLSAAEYIELDRSLQERISDIPPRLLVSEKLQRLVDLLKLRKLIRQVIPFF